MAINVKPIEKLKFRSPARRRRRAPATPDRAPAPLGRAVAVAADPIPLTVGRDPIPTATGIAQRLGWLEREAALDQTPLTVHGDPLAAPLHDPLLRAAAAPSLLREGGSAAALWERSRGAETRVIGLTDVDRTKPAVLTVDAELLARQPNVVVRMLAVLMRAGAWAQAHPAEATGHVARETGATPADVLAAHGEGWHERLHLDLSHRKLDALRAQHDFLRTHRFLDADVDLGAWIDPRPLGMARELLAAERTVWS